MEFTYEQVVNAIGMAGSDSNYNQAEKENALIYLEQLTHYDEGMLIAMQILTSEDLHNNYKIWAASAIKKQLPDFWGKITDEDKLSLRANFFDFYENSQLENNDLLLNMINDILVNIALYEFPQDWPDLESIVFEDISEMEDDIKKFHYYHFISRLISSVDKSQLITPARIQYLRNLFLDHADILYLHITTCFSIDLLVPDGLEIFNGFLQWAPYEQVCDSTNLFHRLCFDFMLNDYTRPKALECLTTVFSTRIDSSTFAALSPLILTSLGSPNSTFPNNKHVTTDQNVLNFLLRVLTRFMAILLTVYDENNVDERTEEIRNSMSEVELGLDELRESLLLILNVIISIRESENLSDEYWSFWITLFHNMLSESKRPPESFKPTLDFMEEILPDVREAIYECVPLDHLNDNDEKNGGSNYNNPTPFNSFSVFCTNRSRNAWSLLALIDPEAMIEFLKEQDPSVAQCYAIGNLEICNQKEFDINVLSSELTELYQLTDSKDPDQDFYVALLFCFSHTLSFENGEFFMNFIDFATKCVNEEGPPISTAATNALLYSIRKAKSGFLNDEYINLICENSESYLLNLEFDDAVRMYKISASLISMMSSLDQMRGYYEKIAIPLLEAMDEEFEPEKIFECIKEASNSAKDSSHIFMSFIWEKLLAITENVILNNPPATIVESCLDAVANAIVNEPYDENRINDVLSWLIDKTNQNIELGHSIEDSFYKFIGYVRSKFMEINERLPDIYQIFIDQVVPNDLASLSSVMWMLSEFQFQLFDFDWFPPLTIESIHCLEKSANVNGLQCTLILFSKINKETFQKSITEGILPSILSAVFASLTDTMHKESMQSFIQFLRSILNLGSKFNLLNNENFTKMFIDAIEENVEEPEAGMFDNFLETLKNSISRPFNFSRTVSEFLILIKKISPNDADAFKVKKDDPNLDGKDKIVNIEPDGQTQEITSSDQKHFRIIKKQTGFN